MIQGLTIGQVAKRVGVSRDTIRIYERQGLIEKPERNANGYRLYSEMAVARFRFILRAKAMGFTLKEIGELLVIKRTATNTCEQVRKQSEAKLVDVEKKISELKKLQKAFKTLVLTCAEQKNDHDCPILEALEQQEG